MGTILAALGFLVQDDLEILVRRYEEEKDLPVEGRIAILEQIGSVRTDGAADFLGRLFEAEKEGELRRCLLRCLVDCGTEGAVRRLVAIAKDERVPLELRQAAVEALGRTSSQTSMNFLMECARSGGALRSAAFASLMAFPLEGAEGLWKGVLEDPDPEIRGRAFRKLAPLKDRRVLELARKAIQDRFEPVAARLGAIAVWKEQGGIEAVRLLLPAAAGAEPEVRSAIALALGSLDGDRIAEAIGEGLRDPSPEVRRTVVEALGGLKHPRAVQRLEGALRDREEGVRLAAVEALAARKDPRAEEILRREAQRTEGETVYAAIRALGRSRSEESFKVLGKLAVQGGVEVRVTALEALGEAAVPEALPILGQALKSREWPVRAVAVRQLSRFRNREVVDLLVDRMGREEGRLVGDIAEALKRITGRGPIYSPVHWKDWWAVNRETFSFDRFEEAPAEGRVGVTTYHGIPVLSLRIIFCLDVSGSMDTPLGQGAETRLQMAKKELARTLSSLDRSAKANLIFFDDRVEPWMRELVSVKANLPRALALVEAAKPRGGTNIYDTLALCFTDGLVDTIFLLSDGEPTMGKFTDPEDILREVRRMNRPRQIAIHTVSLGPSPFLRKLAEENGGQYMEVRGDR